MEAKINKWFADGQRGVSAEALAAVMLGRQPKATWAKYGNHPHDASDFSRCVGFLDAVPEARAHLDRAAALSPVWDRLVANWTALEAMHREQDLLGLNNRLHDLVAA